MRTVLVWLHLVGLTFWAGGLFVNTIVLLPSLPAIGPAERGKLLGAYLKRFAPLAWGALGVVAITGLILTNNAIGFSTLLSFSTRYGNLLLAKIVVVAVMSLNGAYLGFVVGPKMASFAPPPGGPPPTASGEGGPPPGPPPELLGLQNRMSTLSWVQVVLALAVLLLMGLM